MSEDVAHVHADTAEARVDLHLVTDQDDDRLLTASVGANTCIRLFLQRCAEAQAQSAPAQDYAEVVCEREGDTLCFCVCDGVGSSYRGDFAARYLGSRLVAWLRALDPPPTRPAATARRLSVALAGWSCEGQRALLGEDLPQHARGLVREVLTELRERYGSETVFFAGRIDQGTGRFGVPRPPTARALCVWMGNVRGLLVRGDGSCLHLNADGTDEHRWSTARGLRGPVAHHLHVGKLSRLLVYTDGLEPVRERLCKCEDDGLRQQAAALLHLPASDDLTLLDVRWAMQHARLPGSTEETGR